MRLRGTSQRRIQGINVISVDVIVAIDVAMEAHIAGIAAVLNLTTHNVVVVVVKDPLDVAEIDERFRLGRVKGLPFRKTEDRSAEDRGL